MFHNLFTRWAAAIKYSLSHPHADPAGVGEKIQHVEGYIEQGHSLLALVPDGYAKTAATNALNEAGLLLAHALAFENVAKSTTH